MVISIPVRVNFYTKKFRNQDLLTTILGFSDTLVSVFFMFTVSMLAAIQT